MFKINFEQGMDNLFILQIYFVRIVFFLFLPYFQP
jgi:hypothetical protein